MKNVGKISIIFFKKMFEPNLFKVFSFLLLLFSVGCNRESGDVSITPPCDQRRSANIDVPVNFLGFCDKFFEGNNAKEMRVEVTVDGFSLNGKNVQTTLMDKFTFNKTNDVASLFTFMTLPIELPECGSYVITVTVRGKDNTCFKCCSSDPRIPANGQCSLPKKGIVNYRAVSVQINADAANPPPSRLTIEPKAVNCTDCGC